MKQYSSEMKKVVLNILKSHDQLEKFLSSEEFHYRIERPSFLPLVIERQSERVTVTHLKKINVPLQVSNCAEFFQLFISSDGSVSILRIVQRTETVRMLLQFIL